MIFFFFFYFEKKNLVAGSITYRPREPIETLDGARSHSWFVTELYRPTHGSAERFEPILYSKLFS